MRHREWQSGAIHGGFILKAQTGRHKPARLVARMAEFYELKNILTIPGDMLGNSRPGPDPRGCRINSTTEGEGHGHT